MVRTCDFPGCNNKDVPQSLHTFHRFPTSDIAVRQLWLLAIGRSVETKLTTVKKLRVCGAHFSEEDYVASQPGRTKKRVLKRAAVPVPQVRTEVCRHFSKRTTGHEESATSVVCSHSQLNVLKPVELLYHITLYVYIIIVVCN